MDDADDRLIEAYERGVKFGYGLATRSEQQVNPLLLKSVSILDLSTRARNCLDSAKILTVGHLIDRPASQLREIRNLGDNAVQEIRDKLLARGLFLCGEDGNSTPSVSESK